MPPGGGGRDYLGELISEFLGELVYEVLKSAGPNH